MQKNTNVNYVYVDDDYAKKKNLAKILHIKMIPLAMKNKRLIIFI
jgi:hypothetical protein